MSHLFRWLASSHTHAHTKFQALPWTNHTFLGSTGSMAAACLLDSSTRM